MAMHAQLFDSLLQLIPAKVYITEKNDEALDPENKKSIAEIQQEKAEELKKQDESDDESDDEDNNDVDMEEAEKSNVNSGADFSGLADENDEETKTLDRKQESGIENWLFCRTRINLSNIVVVQPMQKGDISELRSRLHERIAQLRKKRNADNTDHNKARSREDILAARLKKKEDRKKALKARKEKGSKAAPEELVQNTSSTVKATGNGRPSADSIKMDGDVFFGKLDVGEQKKKGSVDAKSQLKKIEAKQEKLEKLRKENKEKADAIAEKEEWSRAIAMATGEKVKDDVKLLKKTVKRQEKQKSKSASQWKDRLDKVKKDEEDKVKKRNENIQKRIEAKKDRKKGKKARPGFEGGKRGKGGKVTKPNPKPKGRK
ncbi:hypothetical protein EC973_007874 [Apophysomyces ossiformis]|uniref:Uncharacterized protein n=1 Tax=Apophysomyces ossiformis TaxID=679940 RepID=A0A8H7BXI9_9FUNG|nr:hypothetical protein EC973_007874 [Apophysomyces ossiformis]